MSENPMPFSSPVLDAAIAMHELFLTLVQAGFTERQAIILVAETVRPRDDTQ